jgi:ribosomal protein S18 acetylase RimI-like enzyme
MSDLRIEPVADDAGDALLAHWRDVHNAVIPTHPLTLDEVRGRATRNHLTVARLDDTVIGSMTVRPPAGDDRAATVIARILPGHRRRGFGRELYLHGLATAHALGAQEVDTIVLATNESGLGFALKHGFTETARHVPDGDAVAFIDLRLTMDPLP